MDRFFCRCSYTHIKSGSKRGLLQELSDKASKITGIDSRTIFDALLERESLGTTGFGGNTALPHALSEKNEGKISDGILAVAVLHPRLRTQIDDADPARFDGDAAKIGKAAGLGGIGTFHAQIAALCAEHPSESRPAQPHDLLFRLRMRALPLLHSIEIEAVFQRVDGGKKERGGKDAQFFPAFGRRAHRRRTRP